jgi:hypothetical protein
VPLKDPAFLMTLSGEERKSKGKILSKYRTEKYLNEELYVLAEKLFKSGGASNRFKKYASGTPDRPAAV